MVGLGALVAAGHRPSDIFDWTWGEIVLGAEAVTAYHGSMLDVYFRTILSAFGVDAETGERAPTPPPGSAVRKTGAVSEEAKRDEQVQDLFDLVKFAELGGMGAPIVDANGNRINPSQLYRSIVVTDNDGDG